MALAAAFSRNSTSLNPCWIAALKVTWLAYVTLALL